MKKNWFRRLLAGAAALALAFSLTACGGDGAEPVGRDAAAQDTVSPGETVAAAMEKLAGAQSMTMSMEQNIAMTFEMEGQKQEFNTLTQMDLRMIQEPLSIGGQIEMDLGAALDGAEMGGEQAVELYLVPAEGGMELYLNTAGQWVKQTLDSAQAEAYLGQYNAAETMKLYLDSATDFTAAGQDGDTAKYTGVIRGENIQKVLDASGALNSVGSLTDLGLSEEETKAMFDSLGDLPMTVWIDAAGYPVQYEMDMTAMLSGVMNGAMEAAGAAEQGVSMTVSAATAKITCADFDSVSEITLPEGAAGATAVEGLV